MKNDDKTAMDVTGRIGEETLEVPVEEIQIPEPSTLDIPRLAEELQNLRQQRENLRQGLQAATANFHKADGACQAVEYLLKMAQDAKTANAKTEAD